MVKYGCNLSCNGLENLDIKNEMMNSADFLQADSDAITFG